MTIKRKFVSLLLSCACVPTLSAWAEPSASREASIKAVLIFKMVKFIDWPTEIAQAGESLQLCALGDSPVSTLLATLNIPSVRGRPVKYRKVTTLSGLELKGCHVLYLPDAARDSNTAQVVGPRMRGLLTISDAPNFIHRGGMVGLVRQENKVTFEINLTIAREEGLQPSAQLLELATLVE